MKKTYKHLGQVIKEFRVKADLTQKELATKLGYSIPQFISLMENGHSKIPLNILGELISFLKIPEKMVVDLLLETYKKEAREQISSGRKKASGM
ncbi:MAG: helix-turn-helix transcriptional regulator [Bdellovibrio sp.]|nr:helix-turn-helix transcriptional regulator [Bdellovibrio sp.]